MEFPHTTVIPVTTDISDRKNMKFLWNDGANALVNAAEGIILQRQNVVNSAGEIKDGINIAYAFEVGVPAEQRTRLKWDYDVQAWFAVNIDDTYTMASGTRMKWVHLGSIWQFIQE